MRVSVQCTQPVNHAAVRAVGKHPSPRFPRRNGDAAVAQGWALQEPTLPAGRLPGTANSIWPLDQRPFLENG